MNSLWISGKGGICTCKEGYEGIRCEQTKCHKAMALSRKTNRCIDVDQFIMKGESIEEFPMKLLSCEYFWMNVNVNSTSTAKFSRLKNSIKLKASRIIIFRERYILMSRFSSWTKHSRFHLQPDFVIQPLHNQVKILFICWFKKIKI